MNISRSSIFPVSRRTSRVYVSRVYVSRVYVRPVCAYVYMYVHIYVYTYSTVESLSVVTLFPFPDVSNLSSVTGEKSLD